jgi:micrococcal nuclease
MRRRLAAIVAALIVIVALSACGFPADPPPAGTLSPPAPTAVLPDVTPAAPLVPARVTRVIDGDTIEVAIDGREYDLRYIGIDTPETVHPGEPVEWMGPEATEANRRLVEGQEVLLEKDVSETDRYGRLLRYVWLPGADGEPRLMVNAALLKQGYAQVSTYPPDVRYEERFLALQEEAREAGRGLWGERPTATPGG